MSQISGETDYKIIELINNTSVSRLADSGGSALYVMMKFPSSLTCSYRGSLGKWNLIIKVGETLKSTSNKLWHSANNCCCIDYIENLFLNIGKSK